MTVMKLTVEGRSYQIYLESDVLTDGTNGGLFYKGRFLSGSEGRRAQVFMGSNQDGVATQMSQYIRDEKGSRQGKPVAIS